jgi:hypothetical protein
VLSLERLSLSQDCCPSVAKDLVGAGQHTGEEDWRCFLLGTRPEPSPEHHLHLLQSRRRTGAGRTSCVTPSVRRGVRIPQLGPPPPLRHHPTPVPLPPDSRLGYGKPLAPSWQQLGADRRHHSQQMPAAESQTHRWAWYPAEEVWPWDQRGRKP